MFKSRKNGVNRFAAATATHRQRIQVEHNSVLDSEYPFRLNFYNKPPAMDITIEEFELFALDRLQGNPIGFVSVD
jgi:DNA primase large subunit